MNTKLKQHLDSLPGELRLMLDILQGDAASFQSRLSAMDPIDWTLFLNFVRHHRVVPSIYLKLKHGGTEGVPAFVIKALSMDYRANTLQMLRFSQEMHWVCEAFHNRGIPALVLKGPVVAKFLYGDISMRVCKDLDLLIPLEQIEPAEQLLVDAGYVLDHDIPRLLDDWKRRNYHVTYTHPEKKIQIEVHWRLNPDPDEEPPFLELWNSRQRVAGFGSFVYMLGNEHLLYYLVSHGARHGWFRLRWLEDVARLTARPVHRGQLALLLDRYRFKTVIGQALVLAQGLLHHTPAKEVEPFLHHRKGRRYAADALVFIRERIELSPEPPDHLKSYFKKYVFRLKTAGQKRRYMLERLYPTSYDVQFLPLPKSLYFLYFPLRPFTWLLRRLKKQPQI